MTKPKYQVGDKMWIMEDNKPLLKEIKGIYLSYGYSFADKPKEYGWVQEVKIFETKEDLLKSL